MTAANGSVSQPHSRGRVLLVTSSFPRWPRDSTTPFILHLAQDLQALGWHVQVLAPHAPGALLSERVDGIEVTRFRYLWPESAQTICYNGGALLNLRINRLNLLKLPVLVLAEIISIAQVLRGGRYDVVHSHWILPQGFAAGLVARTLRIPHVETVHGSDVFALRGRILTTFKRFALRQADVVTVNSSATLRAVSEIAKDTMPVVRIPMGASSPQDGSENRAAIVRARYQRGSGPLMIFVGRLIEEKGVGDFIEAIAIIRNNGPDAAGIVVGDGPDRAHFQERARTLGIAESVHFAGWIQSAEVGDFLLAADVFVAPSKRSSQGGVEGQGLTIVEAMLAGVPVIASKTGGVVDTIVHGETGLLVPEGDPAAIAAAITSLQRNAALRARLVSNARSVAERDYTRATSAKRFSELFDLVMRRR